MHKSHFIAVFAATALILVGAGCTTALPPKAPKVGDPVLASFYDTTWRPAVVESVADGKYAVQYDDGDGQEGLTLANLAPRGGSGYVEKGEPIVGLWFDGNYYGGVVSDFGDETAHILWYDRTESDLPLDRIVKPFE